VAFLQPAVVFVEGGLQADFSQGRQAGKRLTQRRQPTEIPPDDMQHFTIPETPQTTLQAMFPDGRGEAADIRPGRLVEVRRPGRKSIEHTSGEIAAIPYVLQPVLGRDGDRRQYVPAGFPVGPGHPLIIKAGSSLNKVVAE